MRDRRTFIIDTDTASDDADALVMALRHPAVEVAAITVVAGNFPHTEAVHNALHTVARLIEFGAVETHLAGFDLPDPIAMAVAIDQSAATRVDHLNVRVETRGDCSVGQTVVDRLEVEHLAPNVHVVLEASRAVPRHGLRDPQRRLIGTLLASGRAC
jgi:inosine-uridine nucleoside N-ribohydrolase